ncbi:hypothetical protein GJ496_001015 [Pomphorhynchus laevis]|nr:hypothetical protein GJ496_001015 [Pomphorhynchus laevis]
MINELNDIDEVLLGVKTLTLESEELLINMKERHLLVETHIQSMELVHTAISVSRRLFCIIATAIDKIQDEPLKLLADLFEFRNDATFAKFAEGFNTRNQKNRVDFIFFQVSIYSGNQFNINQVVE